MARVHESGLTTVSPHEQPSERPARLAEDVHLDQPNAPPASPAKAVPAPPRASLDPEPPVADDPHDFELPK